MSLTPEYTFQYDHQQGKLENSKSLASTKTETTGNTRSRTKLKIELKVLPDVTKDNNERVTKLSVGITVDKRTFHQYEWEAIVDTTLYDRQAEHPPIRRQEKREFAKGKDHLRLILDLAPQEKIDRSRSKSLEIRVKVAVCGYQADDHCDVQSHQTESVDVDEHCHVQAYQAQAQEQDIRWKDELEGSFVNITIED